MNLQFALAKPFQGQTRCLGCRNGCDARNPVADGCRPNPAFVGAGAVVNKDVKPYALMLGVPARQAGWMSEFGEQLLLPLQGLGEAICQHTSARYVLGGQTIRKIETPTP